MNISDLDANKVTVIIAVAAFASPVVTAVLNIWLQLRLKKLELRERVHRETIKYNRNVYERYLCNAGKCVNSSSYDDLASYGDSFALACAYAPESIKESLLQLDNAITNGDKTAARKLLPEVSSQVAQVLYRPNDDVHRKYKHAINAKY